MVLPSDELHAHGEENRFGEIDDVHIFSFGEHSLNPPGDKRSKVGENSW